MCIWQISVLALGFSLSALAETSPEISIRTYGEASTLESEGGSSSTFYIEAVRPLVSVVSIYGGVQLESYEPAVGGIKRVAPLAGLELPLGPVRAFAEYRYVLETPRTQYSQSDPRFGFTGGYWWDHPIFGSWRLFSDSYGEFIAIPRIRWNPTLLAFSKIGVRYPLASWLYFDPFLEAYGRESSDPAFGRNALEARAGARLVVAQEKWSTQISVFRRFATWRDAPEASYRFLLAFGGRF